MEFGVWGWGLGLGLGLGSGLGLGLGLKPRAGVPGPPTRHTPLAPIVHKLVARAAAAAAPAYHSRAAASLSEVLREEETRIRDLG